MELRYKAVENYKVKRKEMLKKLIFFNFVNKKLLLFLFPKSKNLKLFNSRDTIIEQDILKEVNLLQDILIPELHQKKEIIAHYRLDIERFSLYEKIKRQNYFTLSDISLFTSIPLSTIKRNYYNGKLQSNNANNKKVTTKRPIFAIDHVIKWYSEKLHKRRSEKEGYIYSIWYIIISSTFDQSLKFDEKIHLPFCKKSIPESLYLILSQLTKNELAYLLTCMKQRRDKIFEKNFYQEEAYRIIETFIINDFYSIKMRIHHLINEIKNKRREKVVIFDWSIVTELKDYLNYKNFYTKTQRDKLKAIKKTLPVNSELYNCINDVLDNKYYIINSDIFKAKDKYNIDLNFLAMEPATLDSILQALYKREADFEINLRNKIHFLIDNKNRCGICFTKVRLKKSAFPTALSKKTLEKDVYVDNNFYNEIYPTDNSKCPKCGHHYLNYNDNKTMYDIIKLYLNSQQTEIFNNTKSIMYSSALQEKLGRYMDCVLFENNDNPKINLEKFYNLLCDFAQGHIDNEKKLLEYSHLKRRSFNKNTLEALNGNNKILLYNIERLIFNIQCKLIDFKHLPLIIILFPEYTSYIFNEYFFSEFSDSCPWSIKMNRLWLLQNLPTIFSI